MTLRTKLQATSVSYLVQFSEEGTYSITDVIEPPQAQAGSKVKVHVGKYMYDAIVVSCGKYTIYYDRII